ncbi:HAD-IC family P-type ATPase [Candidatus Daviesbacteria bacterium]|nr:HAD-IC family P-type ATPase [Candidatus Daviesbacteria bacterium]
MVQETVRVFASQLASPLIYILFLAAVISAFIQHWIDFSVIIMVVLFNSIFGTLQEIKAQNAIKALTSYLPNQAKVIKDKKILIIDTADLEVGDQILLEAGDKISADAQVEESYRAQVDESTLTGESLPREINISDYVYEATLVVLGRIIARVTAIGQDTKFGQLSQVIKQAQKTQSPLKLRLEKFSLLLALCIIGITSIIFLSGLISGFEFREIFLVALALTVSAIPEGLPAALTVILAVGAYRMAQRGAIIKKLAAVETLGSTTLICADKTGTLTTGEMMVEKIYYDNCLAEVTGAGFAAAGDFVVDGQKTDPRADERLKQLITAAALVNDAKIIVEHDKNYVNGDPTEAALIVLAEKARLDIELLNNENPRIAEFPFDPKLRYMATLHQMTSGSQEVFVKGSPKEVIELCLWNQGDRQEVMRQADKMAQQALRVFAIAHHTIESKWQGITHESITGKLQFLGLVGIADPPRPEAYQTIRNVSKAGIRVVMITGDWEKTAWAIAQNVGLSQYGQMATGYQIDQWDDQALLEKITDIAIFARISPEQKMRLIKAFRSQGHIVAMTGDGVNDAPALLSADIGIGMGKSGTDVARDSADMVITDDNLATIVAAVEEGRVIVENLRKVLVYLLSTNFGEILIMISAILLGFPLPLLAVQVLWLNLVTDGFSVVALALDPKEEGILYRKLAAPSGFLVTRTMALRIGLVGLTMMIGTMWLFSNKLSAGVPLVYAQSLSLVTMAAFQWFNVFNSRSENKSIFKIKPWSNKYLVIAILANISLQLAAVYWQPLQNLLRTTSLSIADLLVAILVAGSVLLMEEIRKMIWGINAH